MQKINFQNLPNTTTPLSAQNMNAIQDNAEAAINDVQTQVTNNKPQIITVGLTTDVSMSTSNTYTSISLNNINAQTSNCTFTLKSGSTSTVGNFAGVEIPTGITKIKASSLLQCTNTSGNSMYFINFLYRYRGGETSIIMRSLTSPLASSSTGLSALIPSFLIDVQEGDIIFMRPYKSNSSNSATVNSGTSRTFLTIESVE